MFVLGLSLVPRPRSRFELLPRQVSVLVYADHPTDYVASCQVAVTGDRGMMHSISGVGWFKHWEKPGEVDRLLDGLGVRSLEGYATAAHARLMARALKHVAKVSICESGEMAGRPMSWVTVEKKCGSSKSSLQSLSSS